MALFGKKEKKKREIKEDDSLFVKLWYNRRTHAMIILGGYLIFFLLIVVVAKVVGNGKTTLKEYSGSELKEKFDSFENKAISYNFIINSGDEIYYFSGENLDQESIKGTILHNGETFSVIITGDLCQLDNNEGEDGGVCPDVISYNYFSYKNIYENIKTLKTQGYNNASVFNFESKDQVIYKIYTNDKIVKKIEVIDDKNNYTLNFLINDFAENETANNEQIVDDIEDISD